jgi:hypothetical protein
LFGFRRGMVGLGLEAAQGRGFVTQRLSPVTPGLLGTKSFLFS